MALPSPRAAPVTSAICPVRSKRGKSLFMGSSLCYWRVRFCCTVNLVYGDFAEFLKVSDGCIDATLKRFKADLFVRRMETIIGYPNIQLYDVYINTISTSYVHGEL